MKKIIIVDDDPGVREAFSLIFSKELYEVSTFFSGNVILNNECHLPDIYILDKQLSGIDGLDICRFIKSQDKTKNTPVIMLSASPNIHKLAKIAGADDTLEKPFKLTDIRSMVEKYTTD